MAQALEAEDFLIKAETIPILDVRTPAEFAHGHIPGAINLPLFSNEERAIVGTIYKQQGRQKAILKGLEFIGPRMVDLIKETENITTSRSVLMHCWRGGMRSGSAAWLLELYGYRVYTLKGGYKSFRNWALKQFDTGKNLKVLGGKTGSGKTLILSELAKLGEQIIDLEKLACHKGSSFGSFGEAEPPTQEQFENMLALQWWKTDDGKTVWIEDEGRTIGRKVLPEDIWQLMRSSPVIFLDIPLKNRVDLLVNDYGKHPKTLLMESIGRIKKRLGGLATQQALEALEEGKLDITAEILLAYYDKTYMFGLEKREKEMVDYFSPGEFSPVSIARQILNR